MNLRMRPANENARELEPPRQLTLYARAHWERFEAWLSDNPLMWTLFVRFAREAMNAGHTRYSADAVCHRIRWHVDIEVRSVDTFKVNNNHVAFLARRFERMFPEHAGFFQLRRRRSA